MAGAVIFSLSLAHITVAAGDAPAATASFAGPEKKDGLVTYLVTSDYQEKPVNLYVLLPDTFNKTNSYHVLYVLPAWERSRDGMDEAKRLNLANTYNIICVGPDFCRSPWYADSTTNRQMRYDSYLSEVVVPFVDRTYPTLARPEGRLLIGYSKFGYGAICQLLRHLDVFGRAGSWDGLVMMDTTRPELGCTPEDFQKNYCVSELLVRCANQLKAAPARMAITGYGFGSTPRADQLMKKLGIPHYVDDSIRPEHNWKSGWLGPLTGVLLSDDMAKAPPIGPLPEAGKPGTR